MNITYVILVVFAWASKPSVCIQEDHYYCSHMCCNLASRWFQVCRWLSRKNKHEATAKQIRHPKFRTCYVLIIWCPYIFMCISLLTSLDLSTYINIAGCMSFYTILRVDVHILVIRESSSRFTALSVSSSLAANELRPQSLSLS